MPQVKVLRTFVNKGQTITEGTLLTVSDQIVDLLGDCVEVMLLSPADLKLQQDASEFVRLCMHHENTYPDGHCPVKHDRLDPMTDCVCWQLKNGKTKH